MEVLVVGVGLTIVLVAQQAVQWPEGQEILHPLHLARATMVVLGVEAEALLEEVVEEVAVGLVEITWHTRGALEALARLRPLRGQACFVRAEEEVVVQLAQPPTLVEVGVGEMGQTQITAPGATQQSTQVAVEAGVETCLELAGLGQKAW